MVGSKMSNDDHDEKVGYFEQLSSTDVDNLAPSKVFRLVSAHLSAKENIPYEKFSLRFTLACGTGIVTGAMGSYSIRMRNCVVDMNVDGCTSEIHDAYKYDLPSDIYTEYFNEDTGAESEQNIAGSLKTGIGIRIWNALTLKGEGKFQKTAKKDNLQKRRVESKKHIALIACNGTHWSVGDQRKGDPRFADGLLSGQYFNEDKEKAFCGFVFDRNKKEATVTLQVRARIGSLHIELLDESGNYIREPAPNEREDAQKALKERLRGIVFGQWLAKDHSKKEYHSPRNEIVLAAVGIKAVRE